MFDVATPKEVLKIMRNAYNELTKQQINRAKGDESTEIFSQNKKYFDL